MWVTQTQNETFTAWYSGVLKGESEELPIIGFLRPRRQHSQSEKACLLLEGESEMYFRVYALPSEKAPDLPFVQAKNEEKSETGEEEPEKPSQFSLQPKYLVADTSQTGSNVLIFDVKEHPVPYFKVVVMRKMRQGKNPPKRFILYVSF